MTADGSAAAVAVCSACGAMAPDGATPLTWSTATERGQQRLICADCTRTNLRSIEAKLAAEWW